MHILKVGFVYPTFQGKQIICVERTPAETYTECGEGKSLTMQGGSLF